jgi:FkbM family methyltransferase
MPAIHVALGELVRRASRRAVSPRIYLAVAETLNDARLLTALGWRDFRRLKATLDKSRAGEPPREFHFSNLRHPLEIRPGTSDAWEASHTVVRSCYGQHSIPGPVRFIIDAGANIGDSTCWFLSKYPTARVVAMEPDSDNFRALTRNTQPYEGRVTCVQAGLWTSDVPLRVCAGDSTVSLFVEEARGLPADCDGVSPGTLLAQYGAETVDIFKIDIEGAESRLFSDHVSDWLPRCRMVFVDVHSESAARLVRTTAHQHGFSCETYRELMVLRNRGRSANPS